MAERERDSDNIRLNFFISAADYDEVWTLQPNGYELSGSRQRVRSNEGLGSLCPITRTLPMMCNCQNLNYAIGYAINHIERKAVKVCEPNPRCLNYFISFRLLANP
jgi:hypothetical protein